METASLVRWLRPSQVKQMETDFNRLFEVARARGKSNPPFRIIPDLQKYGSVAKTLCLAHAAEKCGDEGQAQFMRGMAAAFYGLIRLAEADELERALAPRLQPAEIGSAAKQSKMRRTSEKDSRDKGQEHFTFEDLISLFEADNLKFMARPELGLAMANFNSGQEGPIQMLARVDDDRKVMGLSFRLPITVPDDKRSLMAEAVTRANFNLIVGSFEMDMDDGELKYKVTVPLDDAQLSLAQYRHCMRASLSTIRRYLPDFYRIVFGDALPEDVIDE